MLKIRREPAAIFLQLIYGMIDINIAIYTMALFLSSYPLYWVPYYYIAKTILSVIISLAIAPFLIKNFLKFSILIQIFLGVILLCTALLVNKNWYLFPIIIIFLLLVINLIFASVAWNCCRNAFDIIEFKNISLSLANSATIGRIIFSTMNIWLIMRYGIDYIPTVIGLLLLLSCFFIFVLKPLPILFKSFKYGPVPVRYPLFTYLFGFSALVAFGYLLVDYCFRIELATHLNGQEIGLFMSIFTAATYLISMVLTGLLGKVLLRFGIVSLFDILPIFWIILPIAVIYSPNLWTVTAMTSADYLLYNFIIIGRSVALSIFPTLTRPVAQLFVLTIAESAGVGIASVLLILTANYMTVPRIALIVILIGIILVVLTINSQKKYISLLKSENFLKRFSIDDAYNDISHYSFDVEKNVIESLNSSNLDIIRFGYVLLYKSSIKTCPPVLIQHLNSKEPDIRINAIKAIVHFNEKSAVSEFLSLLNRETDPEVEWWAINAIVELGDENIYKQIKEQAHIWSNDSSPEIKAGAIRLLFLSKDSNDTEQAVNMLLSMLQQKQLLVRRIAARVLVNIPLDKISLYLPDLIADEDNIISSYCVDAIFKQHKFSYLPNVISRLSKGGIYHSAKRLINASSDQAIKLLMEFIVKNKNDFRIRNDILIALLAQISDVTVEKNLIDIAKLKITLFRSFVAIEAFNRAKHFRLRKFLNKNALKFAFQEQILIRALRIAMSIHPANHITREIMARIDLAKERFLYWLGTYKYSDDIFGLIPSLLRGIQSERAKALELLLNLNPKREINKAIKEVFSENHEALKELLPKPVDSYLDEWLIQVIYTPSINKAGVSMDNLQKVYVLRQVELFKKLPAEILMIIAEETEVVNVATEETLFLENDVSNGLYIIVSGKIQLIRHSKLLLELKENDFFGEISLIDNEPRSATAMAKTETNLLLINQETFNRIINDLPQVLLSVTQVILRYLRAAQ